MVSARPRPEDFILAHTALSSVPFVPEVRLWMATEVTPLWRATEGWLAASDVPPPFWAFAWAGGQALARFLLDSPQLVRGKTVLDFACGSGLLAIAAGLAGARRVLAVDVDPFAEMACRRNAAENGVQVHASCGDWVGEDIEPTDLIVAGDIWYEREASMRFGGWLGRVASSGTRVLTGDPGRLYAPTEGVRELAVFDVPTPLELEGTTSRRARVLELAGETASRSS